MRNVPLASNCLVGHRTSKTAIPLGCLPGVFSALALCLFGAGAHAEEAPSAHPSRPPWENQRLLGTPDPPLPFHAEPVFGDIPLKQPLHAVQEPGTRRLFIVEQAGRILAIDLDRPRDEPLEIGTLTDHDFYGMTFHPRYPENRQLFVFSNGPNSMPKKQNRILRFTMTDETPPTVDEASLVEILAWDSNGHNGGDLAFGPDGLLYITSGDGTSDSDGDLTGQSLDDLTGGILRIDIEHPDGARNYSIPANNPFLSLPGARPENYAYGMRNPWRLTFHPESGDLLVGDVGQDWVEMIYRVRAGGNYGWSVNEGSRPFQPLRAKGPTEILPPLVEHPHSESRSITGGVVYTGNLFPELRGAYVYGDYATGKIWGLRYDKDHIQSLVELADTPLQIVAFAQDDRGEILVVDHATGLHRLIRSPAEVVRAEFPRLLGETGLFVSTSSHQTAPGIVPYTVMAPLWSDGAHKERFLALPGSARASFTETGAWQFPDGTVLVKTFSLTRASNPQTQRRLETRLLVRRLGEWQGYSYRWNENETDAELVPASGMDVTFPVTDDADSDSTRPRTWHFPSRAECMVCHTRAAGYVLGLQTLQMNRAIVTPNGSVPQIRWLADQGIFGEPPPGESDQYGRLVDPADEASDIDLRARSYLFANCAHCHVPAGGGNAAIDLHFSTAREKMNLFDADPKHDAFGIPGAKLAVAGAPERSVLLHRVSKTGAGRMPPLSSSLPDPLAVRLLAEWLSRPEPKPADDARSASP